MAAYGYIRVSSMDQNEDRQMLAMKQREVSEENVFMDKLVSEETKYFPAIMPLFFFGVFWAAAMFLFNHPRLSFIGIAAPDVAAVMSIEIKKDRRNKEKAA